MGTQYVGTEAARRALDAYIKLLRASESIAARLSRRLKEQGLTMSQLGVLEALLHLGPLHQRQLGKKLLKSSGNITTVVDNLERDGWVERVRGTKDRRYVKVHLTDAGRERIERIFPEHLADIRQVMEVLAAEELDQLGALCKRLGLASGE